MNWGHHLSRRVLMCPMSGCWLWLGKLNDYGYGSVQYPDGACRVTHRISYEDAHGPIPVGLCVLHRCDTRCCVNPSHLFLGTRAENSADMVAKGRSPRGAANHFAKLTDKLVADIISAAGGASLRELGRRFGVHQSTVGRILSRQTWKHVIPVSS